MFEDAYGNRYYQNSGDYYDGTGYTFILPSGISHQRQYRQSPTSRDSGWYKCPFCGRRQNVNNDGGNCLSCNGDVMQEGVR